jgi:hypothetical protein
LSKLAKPANILLEKHMRELGLKFKPEYRFAPPRRWRFDYVICRDEPRALLAFWEWAIEIEGGLYAGGRHTRGTGYEADLEKYNTAATLKWRVLRFSTGQVLRGEAKEFLQNWLGEGVKRESDDSRRSESFFMGLLVPSKIRLVVRIRDRFRHS